MSEKTYARLAAVFGGLVHRVAPPTFPTTYGRGGSIARIAVTSIEEVSAVLAFCQSERLPVHPISGGANWGFGALTPWSDGSAVLLDLRNLNRVVAHDETWGVLTVQAGVTFQAAFEHLESQDSSFMLNSIGGSPFGSVLANAVERGHGIGAFNDRFTSLRRLKVVLPTGEIVRTDFEQEGGCGTHRWGTGPTLRGLFSQSNYGVVVEGDILLAPRPRYWEAFSSWFMTQAKVETFIDRIREARCTTQLAIQSAHRVWSDTGERNPTRTTRVGYPLRANFVYHSDDPEELAATRKRLEKLSRGLKATRFIESGWSRIQRRALTGMPADVELRYVSGLRPDRPHEKSIRSIYRVMGQPPPVANLDLDRDAVGLLWATPVVPMRGTDVLEAVRSAEAVALACSVEPDIVLCSVDDWRFMDGIFGFAFDATKPGKLEAAQNAFMQFDAIMRERGYPSYRTGVQHEASIVHSPERLALLGRLKKLFDPANVLSPSRTTPLSR